ncbi:hypothetical protein HDV00_000631 [Rhizophlyctis rosea]|nr:hypothetical protein HDV00_000631 [Rhizophlyctis rosea]
MEKSTQTSTTNLTSCRITSSSNSPTTSRRSSVNSPISPRVSVTFSPRVSLVSVFAKDPIPSTIRRKAGKDVQEANYDGDTSDTSTSPTTPLIDRDDGEVRRPSVVRRLEQHLQRRRRSSLKNPGSRELGRVVITGAMIIALICALVMGVDVDGSGGRGEHVRYRRAVGGVGGGNGGGRGAPWPYIRDYRNL